MNPFAFIESRAAEVALSDRKRPTPLGSAKRDAIGVLLWIMLKLTALAYLFIYPIHYFGGVLRIIPFPIPGDVQFATARVQANMQEEAKKKIAADIVAGTA